MNRIIISEKAINKHKDVWSKSIKSGIDYFLNGKFYTYKIKYKKKYCFSCNKFEKEVLEFISKNLENILVGTPDELESIINEIEKISKKLNTNPRANFYNKILPILFDYKLFSESKVAEWSVCKTDIKKVIRSTPDVDFGKTHYLQLLNVNCCPYCNRAFTMTTMVKQKPNKGKKTKIINPALDHFLSQKKYPYLAISLYNLIPCCFTCNTILKRDEPFLIKDYIHPFKDSFHEGLKFTIDGIPSLNNNFEINYKPKNNCNLAKKAYRSARIFALKDLYNQHKDYAKEIFCKKIAYSDDWTTGICEKLNITQDEALRYYYGNYLNEEEINQRPLSKLTIDILDDLDD